jgi:hypothetical protein
MGRASCGGVGNNFFEVARLADKGDEVAPIIVIESINMKGGRRSVYREMILIARWPTIGVSRNNDTKEILIAKWPTSV